MELKKETSTGLASVMQPGTTPRSSVGAMVSPPLLLETFPPWLWFLACLQVAVTANQLRAVHSAAQTGGPAPPPPQDSTSWPPGQTAFSLRTLSRKALDRRDFVLANSHVCLYPDLSREHQTEGSV